MDSKDLEKLYKMLKEDDDSVEILLDIIKQQEYNRGIASIVKGLRKGKTVTLHHIYSANKGKAIEAIDSLVGDKFIVKEMNGSTEYYIECMYDTYIYRKPNEYARGFRCHHVHIDSDLINTHNEVVKQVIEPSARLNMQLEDFKFENYIHYY